MQRIKMLDGAFLTDDSPVVAKSVTISEYGALSLSLVVSYIYKEDDLGYVRVSMQGSDDAENWTEIEVADFPGIAAETLTLRNSVATKHVRPRISLVEGAIGAVVALELVVSLAQESGT